MDARTSLCSGFLAAAVVSLSLAAAPSEPPQPQDPQDPQVKKPSLGYDDTPLLPGTKWHVHDGARPQPRVVRPGTASTAAEPGEPPSDAIVLFAGEDLGAWTARGGAAGWNVEDGFMEVNGAGDIETREQFGDIQLHVEWAAPPEVRGTSQGRGNSGIYLMGRYEIQVLDSHGNQTYPDGQAAALYGQFPPLVNACRAPGAWQSYDIVFQAPRFDGDRLLTPAFATVLHNGVVVQNHQQLIGASAHRQVARYAPHPAAGPIKLQDHGNPVRYRNIWVRRL